MKEATSYVLRQCGSNNFVKNLPHDFDDENFVSGWENTSKAIQYDSVKSAQAAADADPDGESLMVEPA